MHIPDFSSSESQANYGKSRACTNNLNMVLRPSITSQKDNLELSSPPVFVGTFGGFGASLLVVVGSTAILVGTTYTSIVGRTAFCRSGLRISALLISSLRLSFLNACEEPLNLLDVGFYGLRCYL